MYVYSLSLNWLLAYLLDAEAEGCSLFKCFVHNVFIEGGFRIFCSTDLLILHCIYSDVGVIF